MHLMIYFKLNDPEIGKHYNCTQKMLKLGMVSSFYPHNMCAKVETVTTKIGCTSCTNWTIFQTTSVSNENSSITKAFHFSKLISNLDFFSFNMHYSRAHPKISTLSDLI